MSYSFPHGRLLVERKVYSIIANIASCNYRNSIAYAHITVHLEIISLFYYFLRNT